VGGGASGGARNAVTFTQECAIPVERERLWDFLMDVPSVAKCVPGVEGVEAVDAKAYRGNLRVQVGPIRLALHGTMTVDEQDRAAWRARMRAEANDGRVGGGIRARMSLTLAPGDGGTRLRIDTDLTILGRIGEFGQPVIKKKADALLEEFARNLGSRLQQGG
jgi:carbon-monoxide dehydrogenase small subunit